MLAFMAYPPPRKRGSSSSLPSNSNHLRNTNSPCHHDPINDSVTTASMDEHPPQSVLSLSSQGTAATCILEEEEQPLHIRMDPNADHQDEQVQRRAGNCCAPPPPLPKPPRDPNSTQMYIEKIYENTVHGPCQSVTMCELEHMDLLLNCQQPLSFLGFGHHPASHTAYEATSYHEISEHYEDDFPGMYAVPKGCEYCGASNTRDCNGKCRRPKMFFHKKRPPFAPPDDSKWDPETDLAVRNGNTPRKQPMPHTQNFR